MRGEHSCVRMNGQGSPGQVKSPKNSPKIQKTGDVIYLFLFFILSWGTRSLWCARISMHRPHPPRNPSFSLHSLYIALGLTVDVPPCTVDTERHLHVAIVYANEFISICCGTKS